MHGTSRFQAVPKLPREAELRPAVGLAFLPLAVVLLMATLISGGVPSLKCVNSILRQSTNTIALSPSP